MEIQRTAHRQLQVESLESRLAMAVQSLLVLDAPLLNAAVNILPDVNASSGQTLSSYRQLSMVRDNAIQSIGVHPQGSELVKNSRVLSLPTDAVDAVVEQAWDADTGVGFALLNDNSTTAVLWLDAETTVRLGAAVPLAGYQRADQSVVIAYELDSFIRVERYGLTGTLLNSVSLSGDMYASAQATPEGIALMGIENEQPAAALVDQDFVVTEVTLAKPVDATFASAIGIGRNGTEQFFAGSMIDTSSRSRLAFWDLQGNLIDQVQFEDTHAVRVSGQAMLVDTTAGNALLLRDPTLAAALNIEVNQPTPATDLQILTQHGFTNASLTEIIQRDNELFLGVVANDKDGQPWYGIVAVTAETFPSPWQVKPNPLDVNRTGQVTPLDALLIINELNSSGARVLSGSDLVLGPGWDVNGDGAVTPLDVLLIINHLNTVGSSEGEPLDETVETAELNFAACGFSLTEVAFSPVSRRQYPSK